MWPQRTGEGGSGPSAPQWRELIRGARQPLALVLVTTVVTAGFGIAGGGGADDFAAAFTFSNALFAGLAFVALIYTLDLQRKALDLQRQELGAQVDALRAQQAALEDQVREARRARREAHQPVLSIQPTVPELRGSESAPVVVFQFDLGSPVHLAVNIALNVWVADDSTVRSAPGDQVVAFPGGALARHRFAVQVGSKRLDELRGGTALTIVVGAVFSNAAGARFHQESQFALWLERTVLLDSGSTVVAMKVEPVPSGVYRVLDDAQDSQPPPLTPPTAPPPAPPAAPRPGARRAPP